MIRAAVCALMLASAGTGKQAAAQHIDDVYGLVLQAGVDADTFQSAALQVFARAEVSFLRSATDLPNVLADPDYFHIELHQWAPSATTDMAALTVVSCTQLGRASITRLERAGSNDLNGELPNFRFADAKLRPDASAYLTCLIQFQTLNPMVPFAQDAALGAMARYPGETVQRQGPKAGAHVGQAGWSNWYERRSERAVRPGLIVERLGFLNGMLGQDLHFVAQVIR